MLVRKVFGAPRRAVCRLRPTQVQDHPLAPHPCTTPPPTPCPGVSARCIANFILFLHCHAFLGHRLGFGLRVVVSFYVIVKSFSRYRCREETVRFRYSLCICGKSISRYGWRSMRVRTCPATADRSTRARPALRPPLFGGRTRATPNSFEGGTLNAITSHNLIKTCISTVGTELRNDGAKLVISHADDRSTPHKSHGALILNDTPQLNYTTASSSHPHTLASPSPLPFQRHGNYYAETWHPYYTLPVRQRQLEGLHSNQPPETMLENFTVLLTDSYKSDHFYDSFHLIFCFFLMNISFKLGFRDILVLRHS
ncbi:unnamed protein product [Euphydryas editha]|uniref:Uncharacterized protein n=1 Tax=Euphydryas editha TaxID=104508 RepID=A0AAU9VBS7_EUPED|nr:unnamed protein product [Euphydryas editha]